MSDAFWVAMFAGLPPTIAVIVTSILQLRKTDKVARDAVVVAGDAKKVADMTHALVNSRLQDEIRDKERALARVKELEKEIDERYKT